MNNSFKQAALDANIRLGHSGLVLFTWGNVSVLDRASGLVAIKPSGVEYDELTLESIVVTDLEGKVVEGSCRPSSDLMTHLELYKHFPDCGSVVHTHSRMACAWAQAGMDIPALGTTHADYFYGDVPCARALRAEEINGEYEKNTGLVIAELFRTRELDPKAVPGALVFGHGPFAWGKDAQESVYHATVLEEIATMAYYTRQLNPMLMRTDAYLLDKHYQRKHGKNAYYGQPDKK